MQTRQILKSAIYLTLLLLLFLVYVEGAQTAPVELAVPETLHSRLNFGKSLGELKTTAPIPEDEVPVWCPDGVSADDGSGTCASPYTITCNQQVIGDTTGQQNNISGYDCTPSWHEWGPEDVYQFTLAPGRNYTLTASVEYLSEVDMDVFLIASGGCPGGQCLNEESYGNNEAWAPNVPPGTYYIIVDGFGESRLPGPYKLDFTCEFPNHPPNTPSDPSPAHLETRVSVNPTLSWTDNGDPDGDEVVFSVSGKAAGEAGLTDWCQASAEPSCVAGPLLPNTQYSWVVQADDQLGGLTDGPTWVFTTGAGNLPPYIPAHPYPGDGTTGAPPGSSLLWTGGDPDAIDTVTYDVYFGTASPPPLVQSDLASSDYKPTMAPETHYYWQIVAKDNWGLSTSGPMWEFTSGQNRIFLPMVLMTE